MCTLGVKKIHGRFYLFKNRDREYRINNRVVLEKGKIKKLLITDSKGHCEGLNEYGIGLIEATLRPARKTRFRTISQISRRILDQKTIEEAIIIIKNNKTSTNVIISDGGRAYIVEKTPDEFAVTKVFHEGVMTNHSIKLHKKNGPKLQSVREWTEARYKRAKKLIKNITCFQDVVEFLSDTEGYPNKSILGGDRKDGWWIPTQCSYIYDVKNKKIFFCKTRPDKDHFVEYKLK